MNSYKFNSIANYILRVHIAEYFNIDWRDVYKFVKNIEGSIVTTQDGKKYKLTLKEIE